MLAFIFNLMKRVRLQTFLVLWMSGSMLYFYAQRPKLGLGVAGQSEVVSPEGEQTNGIDISRLRAICDTIDKYSELETYGSYFSAVQKHDAYENAQVIIKGGKINYSQDEIDQITLVLNQQLRRAPFDYVKDNNKSWFEVYYGERKNEPGVYAESDWDTYYENSDYCLIADSAQKVLTAYQDKWQEIPNDLIWDQFGALKKTVLTVEDGNEDKKENDKGSGIVFSAQTIINEQASSYKKTTENLYSVLGIIKDNYTPLHEQEWYTKPLSWFDAEGDFLHNYKTHNQTLIKAYIDRIKLEMSLYDAITTYVAGADGVKDQASQYFTEEEMNASGISPEWEEIEQSIESFRNEASLAKYDATNKKFLCGGQQYEDLSELQNSLDPKLATLQNLIDSLEKDRKQLIGKLDSLTLNVQKLINVKNSGTDKLSEYLVEANNVIESSSYLSLYRTVQEKLEDEYNRVKVLYLNLVKEFGDEIEKVEESNQNWQDETLKALVLEAKALLPKAEQFEVNETQIVLFTQSLREELPVAEMRFKMGEAIADLEKIIELYGDADQSMQALIDESKSLAQINEMNAHCTKIAEKILAVEADYVKASENLDQLIIKSERFCEKWIDFDENFKELDAANKEARQIYTANTTETKKNIEALQKAYDDLYAIFDRLGGNSDPYEAQQELLACIKEAQEYYEKYQYDELNDAIKEAESHKTEDQRHILIEQIAKLKAAIENVKVQYSSVSIRIVEQYAKTEKKLKECYGTEEFWQELDRDFMKTVHDSIQTVTSNEDAEELACTNVSLLQKYHRELQTVEQNAGSAWDKVVSDFYNTILEAELLFSSNYPDDQQLNEAIVQAKEKYENIHSDKPVIHEINGWLDALDYEMARVETNDRRNIANSYIKLYYDIQKEFEEYGSDENTPRTSDVKKYLEENKGLYDELKQSTGGLIEYTIPELEKFVEEVTAVRDRYAMFCLSVDNLREVIKKAEAENAKYYEDRLEDNNLYRAIVKAKWAETESLNMDSLNWYNYALADSLRQTDLNLRAVHQRLNGARILAKNKHTVYYGKTTRQSEILDVYVKSESYTTAWCFTYLEKMILELDTCYYHAKDSCEVLEKQIQLMIADADALNRLMNNEDFDAVIAAAINACHSTDGRIAAIYEYLETLEVASKEQQEKYKEAVNILQSRIVAAGSLLDKLYDKVLETAILRAQEVVDKADWNQEDASTFLVIQTTGGELLKEQERVEGQFKDLLAEAINKLQDARTEAYTRNTLYYGLEHTDNEIMKVYQEAEEYLESDNLNDIALMIDSVNNCYVSAAVRCLKLEADIDNLVRKTAPLATLMESSELATLTTEATECRNQQEGRILAMDAIYTKLNELYLENAAMYDQGVADLYDSVMVAKDLLYLHYDVILEKSIAQADEVLKNAGKTSASYTKYSDLLLQQDVLAKEMERVRQEMIETSINNIQKEEQEVAVYTLDGYLVRKVRLSNSDALRGLPEGTYIIGGKKVFIKRK